MSVGKGRETEVRVVVSSSMVIGTGQDVLGDLVGDRNEEFGKEVRVGLPRKVSRLTL